MHKRKLIQELRTHILQEVQGLYFPKKISKKNLSLKTIPKEYETEIHEALSYYPELEATSIEFRISNGGFFTMNALINISSLFRKRRRYYILLNAKRIRKIEPLSSRKGIISVIAHELGHVAEYEHKSFWGIIVLGLRYVFPWSRKRLELQNDIRNYYHGQAKGMILYDKALQKATFLSKRYKTYHNAYYLTEEDVCYLQSLKK